jgi:glycosyltransferase involved in cell wall biosynthesis
MEVLWIGKTGEANVWYHIYPFAKVKNINKVHIVRYKKPIRDIPNSVSYEFNGKPTIFGLVRTFLKSLYVIKNNKIDYIITFNPMPWGIVAWLVSKYKNIPISLGYIGEDFYQHVQTPGIISKLLLSITKRSNIVTVTGNNMSNALIKMGVRNENIIIYPHCVDDKWFIRDTGSSIKYDLISVCKLEPRKRIQDILYALQDLKIKYSIILRFCLVGDGDEFITLKSLAQSLGILNQVDFIGFQNDVLQYLKQSKIYVQTSENEGLSLGLIEAMAHGLLPITTIAGSEEDIILDCETGYFIEIGNVTSLVDKLLLTQNELNYNRIVKNINQIRKKFSIENAIEVCEVISQKLSLD